MKRFYVLIAFAVFLGACSKSKNEPTAPEQETLAPADIAASEAMRTEIAELKLAATGLTNATNEVDRHHWDSIYHNHDSAFWHHHDEYHHGAYTHDDHQHEWTHYDTTIHHDHHYHVPYPHHETDTVITTPNNHTHDNHDHHHNGHDLDDHHTLDSLDHIHNLHHF